MGIDTDGGMIVGALGAELHKCVPEDEQLSEWTEDNGLDRMSLWYDADPDNCYYGFTIENVLVSNMTGEWLLDVQMKALEFEKLTGIPAMLIGTQDVT